jgi:hypothetical protein
LSQKKNQLTVFVLPLSALNDDEISVCEVKCQTHGDDTASVATLTLIESCEKEPLCSSITDSTKPDFY